MMAPTAGVTLQLEAGGVTDEANVVVAAAERMTAAAALGAE